LRRSSDIAVREMKKTIERRSVKYGAPTHMEIEGDIL